MPRWLIGLLLVGLLVWIKPGLIDVGLMVATALLLTAAFLPVVRWLDRRHVPHWASVALCFLVLLGLIAVGLAYVIPLGITQAQQLLAAAPGLIDRLGWLREHWAGWAARFPLLPTLAEISDFLSARIAGWVRQTIGLTGALVSLGVRALTVLVLTFFFLKDGRALLRQLLVLVPPRRRVGIPDLLDSIANRVGDWVLGQGLLMLIIGVASAIGFAVLGLPFALLIAVLAGLLEAVPYLGPLLSGTIAVSVALTQSWVLAVWTVGFCFFLQQLENHLLQPVVVGRVVGLHPVWIILALFVGGLYFGLIGLILAVPAAATIKILIDELWLPQIAAQEEALLPPPELPSDRQDAA